MLAIWDATARPLLLLLGRVLGLWPTTAMCMCVSVTGEFQEPQSRLGSLEFRGFSTHNIQIRVN